MVTSSSYQETLLDLLQQSHDRFVVQMGKLSDQDKLRPFTYEGWSIKDFVSHLSYWKQGVCDSISAYLRGEPFPPALPDGDTANEVQRQLHHQETLASIFQEWQTVHSRLYHLVQHELKESQLSQPIRPPWNEHDLQPIGKLVEEIYNHDMEHFDLVEDHF